MTSHLSAAGQLVGSLLAAAFARLHSGSSLPSEGLWAAAALLEAAGRLGAAVNQPASHAGQLGTHHTALQVQAGLCTDSRAGDSSVHWVCRPYCIASSSHITFHLEAAWLLSAALS